MHIRMIEKAPQAPVNFLEISLFHGSTKNNTQYQLLLQKMNTLQLGAVVLKCYG